jgi:opacity protein-like surface antigen
MKRFLIGVAAIATVLSGAAFADVTTKTTTTFTNQDGAMIREHSVTKHYSSLNDPKIVVKQGIELPASATLYPLPETIKVDEPTRYSYVIINDKPVVVERTTRRIIHTFE